MYQENYEREIDLKDLFFSLLRQWRKIVVIILVIAAAVTGFLSYRTLSAEKDEDAITYEESMEIYEREKKATKSNIRKIEKSLDEQNAYMNEADTMQVNPYKKPQVSAELVVTVEGKKSSTALNAILNMYQYSLSEGEYLNQIAKQQDTKVRYLKKQIQIETENFDVSESDKGISVSENTAEDAIKQGVLHIKVTASTIAKAEKIYEGIAQEFSNVQADATREYGAHRYKVMQKSSSQVVDTLLLDEQQRVRKYITELNASLTEAETQLKGIEVPSKAAIEGSLSTKGMIKYILIGIIAGGFVAVCWYGMRYLLKDAIVSEEQLQEVFGIRGLGTIANEPKKRIFYSIDRSIDHMAHGKVKISKEEMYEMIALNIESMELEGQTIVLSGTLEKEEIEEVKNSLENYVSGYTFEIAENVQYSAKARKQVANAKNVILVEKVHETKCKDVQKEMEIVRDLKAEVVGGVLTA